MLRKERANNIFEKALTTMTTLSSAIIPRIIPTKRKQTDSIVTTFSDLSFIIIHLYTHHISH